jgi:hypothetical protein
MGKKRRGMLFPFYNGANKQRYRLLVFIYRLRNIDIQIVRTVPKNGCTMHLLENIFHSVQKLDSFEPASGMKQKVALHSVINSKF